MADVLAAQIVALNDTMGQMQRTIVQLEARRAQTEDDAMRGSRRGREFQGEDGDVDGGRNLMSDIAFTGPEMRREVGKKH